MSGNTQAAASAGHGENTRFIILISLVATIGGYADTGLLTRAMPVLKARAANLNELSEGAGFLFAARPLTLDDIVHQVMIVGVGGE